MKKSIKKYIVILFVLFVAQSQGQEIILIRHSKVKIETKGWMLAGKAKKLRAAYDTASICYFLPDTVLNKLPEITTDTIYTSNLPRSQNSAIHLFDNQKIFVPLPFFNEFELPILGLPLVLPYKGWTILSRISWLAGIKRKHTETHHEARKRVKTAVAFIEEKSKHNSQVILVTHGFINRNIKNQLKKTGWIVTQDDGKKNLGATILKKQQIQ